MKRVTFLSFTLGAFAPFPLILLTILILFFFPFMSVDWLFISFIGYAAITLSFIGGINWILALQKPVLILQEKDDPIDKRRLFFSIFLCLAGEGSIILGACDYIVSSLIILIVSFFVASSYERKLYLYNELPLGYMPLRWSMTAMMEVCFFVVLLIRVL